MDRPNDMEKTFKGRNFAAIDLGSHTVRLLVAEYIGSEGIAPRCTERRITRLAGGFQPDGALKEPGIGASLAALSEYSRMIEALNVTSTACGATGVVRRASNSAVFLDRVRTLTGIHARILYEEEEALLSAKGVLSVLPRRTGPLVIFDLGGSSTEFLVLNPVDSESVWCTSVFIGASTITERLLTTSPVTRTSLDAARDAIHASIAPAVKTILGSFEKRGTRPMEFTLVGTAGTVTTLAAMKLEMMEYSPHRINGLPLERPWIEKTAHTLASLPLWERRLTKGLEAGREDIIVGGAIIVLCILEAFRQEDLIVTDAGLLEGLLLDHVESVLGCPKTLISPLTWHPKVG